MQGDFGLRSTLQGPVGWTETRRVTGKLLIEFALRAHTARDEL